MIESQEGIAPPREITLDKPTHYYTPAWSPDSKKLLYTDTNLNVWVMDIESGKAKVVGRALERHGTEIRSNIAVELLSDDDELVA